MNIDVTKLTNSQLAAYRDFVKAMINTDEENYTKPLLDTVDELSRRKFKAQELFEQLEPIITEHYRAIERRQA